MEYLKEIEQMYVYENIICKEICIKFNLSLPALNKIIKSHNWIRCYMNKEWLTEQYIKNNLQQIEIAALANCSLNAVRVYLKKFGLRNDKCRNRRKHKLNHNFFEIIDSEEKAYWVGFLMADGCISKRKDRIDNYDLKINLSQKDENHLIKFLKALNTDAVIYNKNQKRYIEGREINTGMSYVKICCSKLCIDLIELNVFPNKTLHELPPENISQNLIRHFIRGYFDGDGSVGIYKDNRYENNTRSYISVTLIGSLELIQWLIEQLNVKCSIRKQEKIYRIQFNGRQAIKILNYMYQDCSIYLDRKYEIYKSLNI